MLKSIRDIEQGDTIFVGDRQGTVESVVICDSLGRSYIEYRCNNAHRCPVETVGDRHRVYEQTLIDKARSGHIEVKG
jgi:hypothetical protein